jgi:hypothetical protein
MPFVNPIKLYSNGKEQMTEFSHLFTEKTTKSLSDGHLWFSVVARPPQSLLLTVIPERLAVIP